MTVWQPTSYGRFWPVMPDKLSR